MPTAVAFAKELDRICKEYNLDAYFASFNSRDKYSAYSYELCYVNNLPKSDVKTGYFRVVFPKGDWIIYSRNITKDMTQPEGLEKLILEKAFCLSF